MGIGEWSNEVAPVEIDWERRRKEEVQIAAQLAKLPLGTGQGYQDDSGAHWEYQGMVSIPVYRCDDGRLRGQSLAAARRGKLVLCESLTFRGGDVGGTDDVRPVASGGALPTLASLAALFVGGPTGALLGAIAGGNQGTIGQKGPMTMTVGELLEQLGVRR